jgi:hypothetical protein
LNRLKTSPNLTPFVLQWKKFYHSHAIMQALNINSLQQHCQNINHDHNLQGTHNLCILETKIRLWNDIEKIINTSKYSYISIYGGHGLIMMYNMQMLLHSYNIRTCNGFEYIVVTFDIKTWCNSYHMCL